MNFPELLNLVRRGIEHSAVYRANKEIARRLAAWTSDAAMIGQLLTKGASGPEIGPAAFVNLSTRNLLGCLSELDAMWQRLAPHAAGSPDAAALGEALDRAMRVFELTGASFQQRDVR